MSKKESNPKPGGLVKPPPPPAPPPKRIIREDVQWVTDLIRFIRRVKGENYEKHIM